MDDSIPDAGHADLPPLVIGHDKFFIAAVFVSAGIQIKMQIFQILFKTITKAIQFFCLSFSLYKFKPVLPNIY